MESGPNLKQNVIRRIVHDVVEALAHVHAHDLIHRDLTPRNIFVTTAGHVKLIDFGLACPDDGEHTQPGFKGTPAYASPEVVNGGTVTPSADLFSLGAICYALLTGAPPFGFGSLAEIQERMGDWRIEPLPNSTPEDLREVTMGLLRPEPSERSYASAGDVLLAFDQFTGPVASNRRLAQLAAEAAQRLPKPSSIPRESFESAVIVEKPGGNEPKAAVMAQGQAKGVAAAGRRPATRIRDGLLAFAAGILLWAGIDYGMRPDAQPAATKPPADQSAVTHMVAVEPKQAAPEAPARNDRPGDAPVQADAATVKPTRPTPHHVGARALKPVSAVPMANGGHPIEGTTPFVKTLVWEP